MAPATGTALLVLVAFVLPGFVAVLLGERTHVVPNEKRTPFELLLLTAYYSVLSYGFVALISWPFGLSRSDLRRMYRQESLGKLAGLALLAIIVVPVLLATLGRLWMQSERLRPRTLALLRVNPGHRVPTAWDELWLRKKPAFVRAVMRDGRVVGGWYGSNSFPGYGEQSQDLLLEQRWVLDDDHWFSERAEATQGVWLAAGEVVTLELYDAPDDKQEDTQLGTRSSGDGQAVAGEPSAAAERQAADGSTAETG